MRSPKRLVVSDSAPGLCPSRMLLAFSACGLFLGLGIYALAQAESPKRSRERLTLVAFLQQEPPAAEPASPTPAELRALREGRIAEMAMRLAAGRDATFERDLEQLILESQELIAAETQELSQALTAANYENRLAIEQAMFDSGFALQYLENATGRFPIPHIISINFPSHDIHVAPNSSLQPAEHWNTPPLDCRDGTVALVDDRGEPTMAELWFEAVGGGANTPLYGGTRSDQALMRSGIFAWWNNPGQLHGPPVTVRIEGLNLAMQHGYQVYVYMGLGISDEHSGGAPFRISIGEGTPLFGGRQLNTFTGEWVRIDATNGVGNYFLSPLLSEDELRIEMAPTGFYPDTKLGCTAINGIQLVGARPRTSKAGEAELTRAAASSRAAQTLLAQAAQELAAAPPPAEVAPNAAARAARLAKWQSHVADEIAAFSSGDYAAVITALQQELAEIPASL